MINIPNSSGDTKSKSGKKLSVQEVFELLNNARIPEDADEYDLHSDDGLVIQGSDINKATTKEKNKQDREKEESVAEMLVPVVDVEPVQKTDQELVQEENDSFAIERKEILVDKKIKDIKLLNDCILIQQEDKWGIIDKKGNWILKPQFEDMVYLEENKIKVKVNVNGKEMYGIINTKGKTLLETKFTIISRLNNKGSYTIKAENGLYGIIDLSGDNCNIVFEPQFKYIERISEDLFSVLVYDNGLSLYGIVDNKGEVIFKPQFKYKIMWFHSFGDTLATNTIKDETPVIIDTKGNILWTLNKTIISGDYDYIFAHPRKDGNIAIFCRKNDFDNPECCGLIDKNNNWILPLKFYDIYGFEKDGTAIVSIKSGDKELRGSVNKQGNWIISPVLNYLDSFYRNYTYLKKGTAKASIKEGDQELRGIIDNKGEWVISPKFSSLGEPQKNGLIHASIKEGDQELRGIIDKKGDWMIKPKFIWINYNNKKAIDQNGNYVFINQKGETIKNYGQDIRWMCDFEQGRAIIEGRDKLYGIIDKDGTVLLKPKFDRFCFNENGLARVSLEKDGKKVWGVINRDGKEIIPVIYDKLFRLEDGIDSNMLEKFLKLLLSMKISVTKNTYLGLRNNKIYIINKDGKEKEIKIKD